MDKEFCLRIFIGSLFFSIYYFIAKNILNDIKSVYLLTYCEFTILGIVGIIGLTMSKERYLLTNNVMKKILFSAITVIGANFVMNLLLRDYDVNKIVSVRQILSIIITVIIAYFFFNENLTTENIIGILFGIISIYLITKK
tara:strand:+ start:127 stop:549 length:423 start_codon:yes stop_codon:yes gene_type:complete